MTATLPCFAMAAKHVPKGCAASISHSKGSSGAQVLLQAAALMLAHCCCCCRHTPTGSQASTCPWRAERRASTDPIASGPDACAMPSLLQAHTNSRHQFSPLNGAPAQILLHVILMLCLMSWLPQARTNRIPGIHVPLEGLNGAQAQILLQAADADARAGAFSVPAMTVAAVTPRVSREHGVHTPPVGVLRKVCGWVSE